MLSPTRLAFGVGAGTSDCWLLRGSKAWLLFMHWTKIGVQEIWVQIIRFVGAGCLSTPVSTGHAKTSRNNLV